MFGLDAFLPVRRVLGRGRGIRSDCRCGRRRAKSEAVTGMEGERGYRERGEGRKTKLGRLNGGRKEGKVVASTA